MKPRWLECTEHENKVVQKKKEGWVEPRPYRALGYIKQFRFCFKCNGKSWTDFK